MLPQVAEQIARVHGVDPHKVGVGGHMQVQLVCLAQVAGWTGHHLSQPAGEGDRGGVREVREVRGGVREVRRKQSCGERKALKRSASDSDSVTEIYIGVASSRRTGQYRLMIQRISADDSVFYRLRCLNGATVTDDSTNHKPSVTCQRTAETPHSVNTQSSRHCVLTDFPAAKTVNDTI